MLIYTWSNFIFISSHTKFLFTLGDVVNFVDSDDNKEDENKENIIPNPTNETIVVTISADSEDDSGEERTGVMRRNWDLEGSQDDQILSIDVGTNSNEKYGTELMEQQSGKCRVQELSEVRNFEKESSTSDDMFEEQVISRHKRKQETPRRIKTSEKRRKFCDPANDSSDDNNEANELDPNNELNEVDPNDNLTLLNILLVHPEQFESKTKPVAVRQDFLCTLNRDIIPIERARADDNGSYTRHGTPSRYFKVTFGANGDIVSTRTCHWDKDKKQLYVTVRTGCSYSRTYLDNYDDIYALKKEYRKSKANSNFQHIFAYVHKYNEKEWCSNYYVSCYSWKGKEEAFTTPRHGNAKKPTAAEYFRTEPNVLREAKSKLETSSPSFVYTEMSSRNVKSFSEQIRDPKQLYNARLSSKEIVDTVQTTSDFERLTHMLKNPDGGQFICSVVMLPNSYVCVAFTDAAMKNIERFCVKGDKSVLRIDTTFEIVKDMWVTDTSYTNYSLIKAADSNIQNSLVQ